MLLQFLDSAIAAFRSGSHEKSGITKIFYALETFCEHLGQGLAPYLTSLMEKLFTAITTTNASAKSCDCHDVMYYLAKSCAVISVAFTVARTGAECFWCNR